jgi:hypothetical protein
VWVGNAMLHSAKDFEASIRIAFSQTSFSDSWPIKIQISSLVIHIHPQITQLHQSLLELIKHSAREDTSTPFKKILF